MRDAKASSAGSTPRIDAGAARWSRHFAALAVSALLLLIALGAARASADTTYTHITTFDGAETPAGAFGYLSPAAMALNQSTGNLYATDVGHNLIDVFDSSGAYQFQFNGSATLAGSFAFSEPSGIAIDNSGGPNQGDVYVADIVHNVVDVFSAAGAYLGQLTGSATPATVFSHPAGIAVDHSGDVYVSDANHNVIDKFSPAGSPLTDADYVSQISDPNLQGPSSIALDSADNLYVTNFHQNFVMFNAAGVFQKRLGPSVVTNTTGVAVDPANDDAYLNDGDVIYIVDSSGNPLGQFPTNGFSNGIAVSAATGDVYLGNNATNSVDIFGLPTATVAPVATTGSATGVAQNIATLNGTINAAGGTDASCQFRYGTKIPYDHTAPCAPTGPFSGSSDNAVSADISGLSNDTTYHFRLVSTNATRISPPQDQTFTTPPAVAGVSTGSATNVLRTTATLNGSFDPAGIATTYHFQYVTDAQFQADGYASATSAPVPDADAGSGSGDTPVSTDLSGLVAGTTYHFRLLATGSVGTTTGPDQTLTTLPAVANVSTGQATNVLGATATLNGSFDPAGEDVHYHFQYVIDAQFKANGYASATSAPVPDADAGSGSGDTPVSADIGGLQGLTTYHYRLVATNAVGTSVGQDQTLTTLHSPAAPEIQSAFASNLSATTADLNARINPHERDTSYHFEYGTDPSYGTTIPLVDGDIGGGILTQQVSAHLSGLQKGITYHFRVVTRNSLGTTTGPDETFNFFPGQCPNSNVRQETGSSSLPECRAYELVSPGDSGGAGIFPGGLPYDTQWNYGTATNPPRVLYSTFAQPGPPDVGNPAQGLNNAFLAARTVDGWVTRYIGYRANQTPGCRPSSAADDSLSKLAYICIGMPLGLFDTNGDLVETLPSGATLHPPQDVPFSGMSGNGQHFVFQSNSQYEPDGLAGSPGSIYDNDLATNTVTVVSKTPNGSNIPNGAPGGVSLRPLAISTNGSHILMSSDAPLVTNLYMRDVPSAISYDISGGHPVTYLGMIDDGSKVIFASSAQMTSDDHDTSVDVFQWAESSNSITRLSTGSGGTGNTDACSTTWDTGCDVQLVGGGGYPFVLGLAVNFGALALPNAVAGKNGAVFFYSPEQLDGAAGAPGKRNLYLERNGKVQYVTTFDPPNKVATDFEVSPDGSHAAFITTAQLTSYDNAGHSEMYSYNATASVACVSCNPNGDQPTSDAQGGANGRYITDDGRVFFSTGDALVPQDTNKQRDVYEYVDGHAQLISAGTGIDDSQLQGVSNDGTDAYFLTRDTLVGQDTNSLVEKLYTAHVGGGFPFTPPAASCVAADECHGPVSSPSPTPQFGSQANLGGGGNAVHRPRKRHHKKRHHRRRVATHNFGGAR